MLTEEMAVRLTSLISTTDAVAIRSVQDGLPTSPIESLAVLLSHAVGVPVVLYTPKEQRAGVYNRDIAMVRSSSSVFAVFSPQNVMDGGTAHVVKAALDAEVPVEAYTTDEEGSLVLIGSDDGNPYRTHSGSRPDVLEEMCSWAY